MLTQGATEVTVTAETEAAEALVTLITTTDSSHRHTFRLQEISLENVSNNPDLLHPFVCTATATHYFDGCYYTIPVLTSDARNRIIPKLLPDELLVSVKGARGMFSNDDKVSHVLIKQLLYERNKKTYVTSDNIWIENKIRSNENHAHYTVPDPLEGSSLAIYNKQSKPIEIHINGYMMKLKFMQGAIYTAKNKEGKLNWELKCSYTSKNTRCDSNPPFLFDETDGELYITAAMMRQLFSNDQMVVCENKSDLEWVIKDNKSKSLNIIYFYDTEHPVAIKIFIKDYSVVVYVHEPLGPEHSLIEVIKSLLASSFYGKTLYFLTPDVQLVPHEDACSLSVIAIDAALFFYENPSINEYLFKLAVHKKAVLKPLKNRGKVKSKPADNNIFLVALSDMNRELMKHIQNHKLIKQIQTPDYLDNEMAFSLTDHLKNNYIEINDLTDEKQGVVNVYTLLRRYQLLSKWLITHNAVISADTKDTDIIMEKEVQSVDAGKKTRQTDKMEIIQSEEGSTKDDSVNFNTEDSSILHKHLEAVEQKTKNNKSNQNDISKLKAENDQLKEEIKNLIDQPSQHNRYKNEIERLRAETSSNGNSLRILKEKMTAEKTEIKQKLKLANMEIEKLKKINNELNQVLNSYNDQDSDKPQTISAKEEAKGFDLSAHIFSKTPK